jgi:hypothetical protein
MQLYLPSRVNFQVTPNDIGLDALARQMYQVKRGIQYPRSPYGMGDATADYIAWEQELARAYAQPNFNQAIAALNQAGQTAGQVNAGFADQPQIDFTQIEASAIQRAGGHGVFTTSRNSSIGNSPSGRFDAYPGDSWSMKITGAAPNGQVSRVRVLKQAGIADMGGDSPVGMTDANGNFSMSGTFGPSDVGLWRDQWLTNHNSSGYFEYTVGPLPGSAPSSQSAPATSPAGQSAAGSSAGAGTAAGGTGGGGAAGTGGATGGGAAGSSPKILGMDQTAVLMLAAGAAVLLFMGRGK